MKYKFFYSERVFYEDTLELSSKDLTEFFRWLVEKQNLQWTAINDFQRRGQVGLLIQQFGDYFMDNLGRTPVWGEGLSILDVTEEE